MDHSLELGLARKVRHDVWYVINIDIGKICVDGVMVTQMVGESRFIFKIVGAQDDVA